MTLDSHALPHAANGSQKCANLPGHIPCFAAPPRRLERRAYPPLCQWDSRASILRLFPAATSTFFIGRNLAVITRPRPGHIPLAR